MKRILCFLKGFKVSTLCSGMTGSVSPYVTLSSANDTDLNSVYHDFRAFTNDSRPDWYFERARPNKGLRFSLVGRVDHDIPFHFGMCSFFHSFSFACTHLVHSQLSVRQSALVHICHSLAFICTPLCPSFFSCWYVYFCAFSFTLICSYLYTEPTGFFFICTHLSYPPPHLLLFVHVRTCSWSPALVCAPSCSPALVHASSWDSFALARTCTCSPALIYAHLLIVVSSHSFSLILIGSCSFSLVLTCLH